MPPNYNEFERLLQNGRPAGEMPGGAFGAVSRALGPRPGRVRPSGQNHPQTIWMANGIGKNPFGGL